MRNYNYRKKHKNKKQERRRFLYETGWYWPTMPHKGISENNEVYYTEGWQCHRKAYIKRNANKAIRKAKLGSIGNYANYKRHYDLEWEWY